jgi:hypothetical protein
MTPGPLLPDLLPQKQLLKGIKTFSSRYYYNNMDNNISIEPVKQRRGRKKKTEEPVTSEVLVAEQNISIVVDDTPSPVIEPSENAPKKRGRKPKGGKLVVKDTEPAPPLSQINNIILHLKCSLSDLNMQNESRKNLLSNPLEYNPAVPPSIVTFNDKDTIDKYASYNMTNNSDTAACNNASDKTAYDVPPLVQLPNTHICSKCSENAPDFFDIKSDKSNDVNMKDITSKLNCINRLTKTKRRLVSGAHTSMTIRRVIFRNLS